MGGLDITRRQIVLSATRSATRSETKTIIMGEENKCFIGNLSWNTDDTSLSQAFSQFGEVIDAKVIMDRETGRSRGFAFVTFADDAGLQAAIGQMDGAELDGRQIRVNKSEKKGKGGGKGGGKGYGGGKGGYGGGKGGGDYNSGGSYGGGGGGGW